MRRSSWAVYAAGLMLMVGIVNPGTHGGEYDIFTLGADNQEGGEGTNADRGNWEGE